MTEKKNECKHYGMMMPESTCIERQEYIHLAKSKEFDREDVMKAKRIAPFYKDTCNGCLLGIFLFKQKKGVVSVEEEKPETKNPEPKKCQSCGESYPATNEFFYPANRAHDNLRKNCIRCVEKKESMKGSVVAKIQKKKKEENLDTEVFTFTQTVDCKVTKQRTCPSCGKEKDLTAENFHRKGDGFFYSCKECRNLQKRQNRSIRQGVSKENLIVLNFTGLEDLKAQIEAWAADQMRDPVSQILYHLKNQPQLKRAM